MKLSWCSVIIRYPLSQIDLISAETVCLFAVIAGMQRKIFSVS